MSFGVTILPKFGAIMPGDMGQEKLASGQITADGMRLTQEEIDKCASVGDSVEPNIAGQVEIGARQAQDMQGNMANPYTVPPEPIAISSWADVKNDTN